MNASSQIGIFVIVYNLGEQYCYSNVQHPTTLSRRCYKLYYDIHGTYDSLNVNHWVHLFNLSLCCDDVKMFIQELVPRLVPP